MFRKRSFACLISMVLLLSACTPVDEEPHKQIYYIEPSERFYVTEEPVTEEETSTEAETDITTSVSEGTSAEETSTEETTAEENCRTLSKNIWIP